VTIVRGITAAYPEISLLDIVPEPGRRYNRPVRIEPSSTRAETSKARVARKQSCREWLLVAPGHAIV